MRTAVLRITLTATLFALGCGRAKNAAPSSPAEERSEVEAEESKAMGAMMPKSDNAPARERKGAHAMAKKMAKEAPSAPSPGLLKVLGGMDKDGMGGGGLAGLAGPADQAEGEPPAKPRAWFPETFLFEPLIVTDDRGAAKVHVKVPDRLTTWRILALAHSREGAQAGTETSFLGTLPIYVDPVLPNFLVAEDEVKLPVQVVNTTEEPLERTLSIDAVGAATVHQKKTVKVAAASSQVEIAELRAAKPGRVAFKASLGSKDAVEKTLTVFPSGRPVEGNRGGTLAAPRAVDVELPKDAEKDAGTVRLLVFPGALALLRAELQSASSRGGVAADAYALLLAGKGDGLLRALGADPDPKALRNLALIAGQRAIRDARAPDVATASFLAEAALSHPNNPVIARLGERLVESVARNQRPDGTFQGETGWTLQRLLVASADSIHAVLAAQETQPGKQRAQRARLLSEGAIERNLEMVTDPYTAAAIAASGAVEGTILERLRQKVRDKVKKKDDGSAKLELEAGIVRGDGLPPSEAQATALSVLALLDDPKAKALLPDLGAGLLGAYDPRGGWGDGETNLVALRAALALFKDPLPPKVKVTLSVDDRPLAEGTLEGARLREVLPLDADLPNITGKHTFRIQADPPVPGLGYSLTWRVYEPWKRSEEPKGLELEIDAPKSVRTGKMVELGVSASAPAGMPLTLRVALPAGVEPDMPSISVLTTQGVRSFRTEDGAVTLEIGGLGPGQSFNARFKVIATLAGTLHSGPSTIRTSNGDIEFVPPTVWKVAER